MHFFAITEGIYNSVNTANAVRIGVSQYTQNDIFLPGFLPREEQKPSL